MNKIRNLLVFLIVISCSSEKEGDLIANCDNKVFSIGIETITHASCNVLGTVNIKAVGGEGAILYSLGGTDYSNSSSFSDLNAGQYEFFAKDENDCVVTTDVTIEETVNNLSINVESFTKATCDQKGSFSVSGSGGSGEVQFTIDDQNFNSIGEFSDLSSGKYTVTAKDSNGCIASTEVDITAEDGLILAVESVVNVNCDQLGKIVVSTTGSSGSILYSIAGSGTNNTGVFSDISAGTYLINAIDDSGCSGTIQAIVGLNESEIGLSISNQSNAGCGSSNGAFEIVATGGESPYSFSLNGGVAQSSSAFNSLSKGNYTVSVTDANGCNTETAVLLTSGVSLDSDIMPIINMNCATASSCHGAGAAGRPVFTTKSIVIEKASRIKARTSEKSMPLGSSLLQSQIDAIACWVDDGAPDN